MFKRCKVRKRSLPVTNLVQCTSCSMALAEARPARATVAAAMRENFMMIVFKEMEWVV